MEEDKTRMWLEQNTNLVAGIGMMTVPVVIAILMWSQCTKNCGINALPTVIGGLVFAVGFVLVLQWAFQAMKKE